MRTLFAVLSALCLLSALALFSVADSAIHEIEAGVMFLAACLLAAAAAIVHHLMRLRASAEATAEHTAALLRIESTRATREEREDFPKRLAAQRATAVP